VERATAGLAALREGAGPLNYSAPPADGSAGAVGRTVFLSEAELVNAFVASLRRERGSPGPRKGGEAIEASVIVWAGGRSEHDPFTRQLEDRPPRRPGREKNAKKTGGGGGYKWLQNPVRKTRLA